MPTTLYRYFDKDGALLYVGITSSRHSRATQHSKAASWWRLAKTATLTHYPSRAKAEDAERAAIWSEHPIYNRAHAHLGPRWEADALVRLEEFRKAHPVARAMNPQDLAGILGVPPRRILLVMRALDLPRWEYTRQSWLVWLRHAEDVVRTLCREWFDVDVRSRA